MKAYENYYSKSEQEYLNDFRKYCIARGMKIYERFGQIFVQYKLDSFMFELKLPGKIVLKHFDSYRTMRDGVDKYHIQFRKEITAKNLATYIYEHATAKYTNRFVKFSVTI